MTDTPRIAAWSTGTGDSSEPSGRTRRFEAPQGSVKCDVRLCGHCIPKRCLDVGRDVRAIPVEQVFEPITCLAHGINVRGGVPCDVAHDLAGPVNESIDSFAVAGRPIPDAALGTDEERDNERPRKD